MGSGHFLVEACRFLGDKLHEACRLCDELATEAEKQAEEIKNRISSAELSAETQLLEAALSKAKLYRQRVIDLPDPDDKLLKYLPSSAPEKEETGYSQTEAIALCRRLVAVHCLYGVDKNPLAVELAKLSLWLESHGEGLPLTFLDHRLVVGDSLTGPFFEHLLKEPGSQDDVQKLIWQGVNQQFKDAISDALKHVQDLEATIGVNISEIQAKEAAKARLDRALTPFKIVAAAWAGGVMLGKDKCDDIAYSRLVQTVGTTGDLPEDLGQVSGFGYQVLESSDAEQLNPEKSKLLVMIARGLGVESVPSKCDDLLAVLVSGECEPALSYDLTFAEVFYPSGNLGNRQGFDAVLGNPPWDRMLPADKEFFAAYDFNILEAPTKRERTEIEKKLKANPEIAEAHENYIAGFRSDERVIKSIYKYQIAIVNGEKTIGKQDVFRVFMERNTQLLKPLGLTGIVVPSAFHANEGATGIRQLYLENMGLKCCYSFENRRKIFEIHLSFKFATVIAQKGKITTEFPCGFYLRDDEWLFRDKKERPPLDYNLDFVQKTGGDYLSLLELQSEKDLEVAKVCFANGEPFGKVCNRLGIKLGRELNMTDDAWRFTPTSEILPKGKDPRDPDVAKQLLEMGYLVLHEGKTFHQYNDRWEERPRYLINTSQLINKPDFLDNSLFYRLAYREIASATNERTLIFSLLLFGNLAGHKAPNERTAKNRSNPIALLLLAILNSYTADFIIRLQAGTGVSKFVLMALPFPKIQKNKLLSHSALRLTCNHAGYLPLWQEQLGNEWREPNKEPLTFPVLSTDDERWQIRATIDAVVADAYGLNREHYAHILSTFSHKSYPKAPQLCLACFDELQNIGLEAFTQKYDPYWDIPLNENLPKPVIELPTPEVYAVSTDDGTFQLTAPPTEKPKSRRKKK